MSHGVPDGACSYIFLMGYYLKGLFILLEDVIAHQSMYMSDYIILFFSSITSKNNFLYQSKYDLICFAKTAAFGLCQQLKQIPFTNLKRLACLTCAIAVKYSIVNFSHVTHCTYFSKFLWEVSDNGLVSIEGRTCFVLFLRTSLCDSGKVHLKFLRAATLFAFNLLPIIEAKGILTESFEHSQAFESSLKLLNMDF